MTCQEAIDVMGDAAEDLLAPALRSGFEEHMAECRPCATYFQHLRLTRDALRGLAREDAAPPQREGLLREFRRHLGRRDDEA